MGVMASKPRSKKSSKDSRTLHGQCLCGAVRFEIDAPFRTVSYCHCRQCARWTGHFVAATAVPPDRFRLVADKGLKWFASSKDASRGFCGACGSSLFWKPASGSRIAIMAGALDPPTGLEVDHHIFVDDKSDYYAIADGLPQHDGWGTASPAPPPSSGKR